MTDDLTQKLYFLSIIWIMYKCIYTYMTKPYYIKDNGIFSPIELLKNQTNSQINYSQHSAWALGKL